MKRSLLTLLALLIAVPVFCGINVSVFGGYTSVGLKPVNDDLALIYANPEWAPHSFLFPQATSYKNKMGNAFLAGFDALYPLFAGISAGARVECVIAQTGGLDWTDNTYSGYKNWKYLYDASMVPVMAGVSYDLEIPKTDFSIGASAFGGWGFAFMKRYLNLDNYSYSEWQTFAGNSFTADLKAGVSYRLSGVTLSLNGGYRLANIQKMKTTEYTDPDLGLWSSDPANTEFKDYNGDIQRNFDFSGLIVDLKATITF